MNDYNNSQEYADDHESMAGKFFKFLGFGLLGIIVVIVFSFSIKLLWNWLMPSIFSLREITYWEGVGLFLLGKIFFGGFGSGSDSSSSKSSKSKKRGPIKEAIHQEMQEEFKKEYRDKYGEDTIPSPTSTNSADVSDNASNEDQEALYDQWWDQEGEQRFEAFLRK